MTISEKIIFLRKQHGMSQEDLAFKLDVSRQAVSKWESGQATPSIDKILQLSDLFEVTVDFLIKDSNEQPCTSAVTSYLNTDKTNAENTFTLTSEAQQSDVDASARQFNIERHDVDCGNKPYNAPRILTDEETTGYISHKNKASVLIGIGVALCVISPGVLFVLLGFSQNKVGIALNEIIATAVGLSTILVLVLCAVALFVYSGISGSTYSFIEGPEPFALSAKQKNEVKEKLEGFKRTYLICVIAGVCLCIFSTIPVLVSSLSEDDLAIMLSLAVLLAIVSVAVFLFVFAGVRNSALLCLLQQGEYSASGKQRNKVIDRVASIYWLSAVAVYLALSFLTNKWELTWIVFAVCGVLYPVLVAVVNMICDRKTR